MWSAQRCCQRSRRVLLIASQPRKHYISSRAHVTHETDSYGIPLRATWSVNELLSSYPTPTITPDALKHLHNLSALIPPAEGSEEYIELKREMEDLVKLVEAVKLVNTSGVQPSGKLEGEGVGSVSGIEDDIATGQSLLEYATRTVDGLYVVEADRAK